MPSLRRLRLLALAALAVAAGSCDVCGLVYQQIIVAPDDPDLGALIDDCMKGLAPDAVACPPPYRTSTEDSKLAASCLPLCERAYAIVNPDPHRSGLVRCSFVLCEGQARVLIEYRSVCQ